MDTQMNKQQDENARNLELIRAAQAKQPQAVDAAPAQEATPKQRVLEIAQRMLQIASSIPTPGVTDTYAHSRTLSTDARALTEIAEKM
jgi:hypothetical protein